MKILSGIYTTDGLSKKGIRFSIGALDDMVWDGSAIGIPSNLSHDIHRFIGWAKISGLYVSHELSYVIGHTFIPECNAELEEFEKMRISFLKSKMLERINNFHGTFSKELNEYNLICDNGKFFYNGIVMYGYKNIVEKVFPCLNEKKDKDGLILLKDLLDAFDYKGQGVLSSKTSNLSIILHPYFRKSFSRHNNFNFEFLDELFKLFQTNQTIKIRIDDDFIGYGPSYIQNMEFEYWFGPNYDDDISKIQNGVTCYKSSQEEKIYNQVDKTEFVWQNKDGKYQFEMEEVMDTDAPTLDSEQFACRYMHSIYDSNIGAFEHFDGAIRQYDLDSICERIDKSINQVGHNSKYTKLFRLDGKIQLPVWKSLITNYLKNNYDVYRYFGMDVPQIQKSMTERPQKAMEAYVPYILDKGDGVKLYISYHNRCDSPLAFSFSTTDSMTTLDGKIETVEFEAINVAKMIQRMGGTIEYPKCEFCACEDNYNNIPQIFHGGDNVSKNVNITVNAIRFLMKKQAEAGKNCMYSFSLAWNMENRLVSVSFMGHVSDINEWMQSFQDIPVERNGFKKWLASQVDFIHSHGTDADSPLYFSHIKHDGILFFQRRDIKNDVEIKNVQLDSKNAGMSMDIVIDKDKSELVDLIKNNELSYAHTCIVKHSICEKSKSDYLSSQWISSIDETVAVLDEVKIQGFVWKRQENG